MEPELPSPLGPFSFTKVSDSQYRAGVSSGAFNGGGVLFLDGNRISGVVELDFVQLVQVKAIILVDTSGEISILAIVSAELIPPIQLSFGFTLNGVGGLLGKDRGINGAQLRDGIKDGKVQDIFFPSDVLNRAREIVQTAESFFPVEPGSFVLGAFVRLGWGTPTFVTLDMGVILRFPEFDFIIMGVLRYNLPTVDQAIIAVNVAFAGGIFTGKQLLTFDAGLFDSHILWFTLDGQMGARLFYGSDASFALTVGGFYPGYHPPSQLEMGQYNRVGFNLAPGFPMKIRLDFYVALTSNTAQCGAKLEVGFDSGIYGVEGELNFDALIQFSPFHFTARLGGWVDIKFIRFPIGSIRFNLNISGPTPWRINGNISFEIYYLIDSETIDLPSVNEQFGVEETIIPPEVDVEPLLQKELNELRNWHSLTGPFDSQSVTLRQFQPEEIDPDQPVVHPFGSLAFTQKVLPINFQFNKFGNSSVQGGPKEIQLSVSNFTVSKKIREEFALAHLLERDESKYLDSPAFVPLDAGLELSQNKITGSGAKRPRNVWFDFDYIPKVKAALVSIHSLLFNFFQRDSFVTQSSLSVRSRTESGKLVKPGFDPKPETFAVVFRDTRALVQQDAIAATQVEAEAMQAKINGANPNAAGKTTIIGSHQLASSL